MSQQQKEQQFLEAYKTYSGAIFRYCYQQIFDLDKTKDFVQETFIRTWKYISAGNQIENIRAFLYKTARNIIIDQTKKKKNISLQYLMEKGFSPSIDPRKSHENYFASQEVLGIINSLDEKYAKVITLKYIDGFSTKEISKTLKQTENNVYVSMHRGFAKVKEMLQLVTQKSANKF